jgi:hypothetical protein
MDQNSVAQPLSRPAIFWAQTRGWLLTLPFKARLVLGIFLVAALVLALHTAIAGKNSSLHLRLQHAFRNGQLTILIDGHRVYSGKLVGYSKKKYGLFGETVEGSLSQVLPVSSGSHEVLVRIEPGDGTVQEETVAGTFASGVGRDLAVSARRSGMALSWQGESQAVAPGEGPGDSTTTWFSRYAGALFLTIAGSIASALTGFAIKELPGYLRTRQESTEKPSSQVSTS